MARYPASRWWRATLQVLPPADEMVSWLLCRQGSSGVEVEETGRAHPGEPDGRVTLRAYFSSRAAALRAARAVSLALREWWQQVGPEPEGGGEGVGPDGGSVRVEPVELDVAAWRRAWAETLRLVRVGGGRIVARGRGAPSAVRKAGPPGGAPRTGLYRLVIPPGMAFGTGHHPSTQQALWALELALKRTTGPATVVDVGTGTGVLALAARRLGAGRVVAVDVDPLAVRVARENARLNGLGGIVFRVGSVKQAADAVGWGAASVVAANLVAETLVELAEDLARLLAPSGVLIVAGITEERAEQVAEALEAQGLVTEALGWWSGWAWVWARRPAEVGP